MLTPLCSSGAGPPRQVLGVYEAERPAREAALRARHDAGDIPRAAWVQRLELVKHAPVLGIV